MASCYTARQLKFQTSEIAGTVTSIHHVCTKHCENWLIFDCNIQKNKRWTFLLERSVYRLRLVVSVSVHRGVREVVFPRRIVFTGRLFHNSTIVRRHLSQPQLARLDSRY